MKETLAIVGSGISGMGSAYLLRHDYDLKVYEKESYVGGHTNTVEVREGAHTLPVDTGFIVFNKVTYPNLLQLFDELGVPYEKSNMSFSFHNLVTGLQYNGSNLNGLFAQRKNIFRPKYYRFLLEINRFNESAPEHLRNLSPKVTLEEYIRQQNFSEAFVMNFLVPMASAVWSTPAEDMLKFPAITLIRFFHNHGFLGMTTQHTWYTVTGGSRVYMNKIREKIKEAQHPDVFTNLPVTKITTDGRKVKVFTGNAYEVFDKVIVAAHAPDALRILENPTNDERKVLSAFRYTRNIATLHSDESVMPPLRRIWSSWNYRTRQDKSSTVYWMNKLQNIKSDNNYFVSINEFLPVAAEKIHKTIVYEHPLFDTRAIEMQPSLRKLNLEGPVYFTGAYFRYGFHEDGYLSAVELCRSLV
ncbi:MAG: NADP transhydrogenase subunit alpha [Candidatus Hydrogenedentota bacterium]|nr:MAG: NADP transhydrogenase subunit alpha [Candidatus Hydrogenedentota bacterium]